MKRSYLLSAIGTFSLVVSTLAVTPYEANLAAGMKTPETSKMFVKHVDPLSGLTSYLLKPGLVDENQQSIYFTSKCMTEDGRFLVFDISKNERTPKEKRAFRGKHKAILDLMKDEFIRLDDIDGQIPYVDVDNDVVYYARFDAKNPDRNWLYKRELLVDPTKEVPVCRMPAELTTGAKLVRYFTHLTLTKDRKYAYLDSRVDDNHVQGLLELATGKYEKWGETGLININHGQINPVRNDIALNAWECVKWKDSKGVEHGIDMVDGVYPRLQLIEKGKRTMIPSRATNYATHERWNEQGDGFYWCSGGVWYHDLKTGEQSLVSPKGAHAMMSCDKNLVISDCPVGPWYRGCAWQVFFFNRKTNRGCYPFTYRPPLCPWMKDKNLESHLHPDPHPMFVCGDRYVVCTINNEDGHMDLAVTPVAGLVARTEENPETAFDNLPARADPTAVGTKLSEHFLETPPDAYGPKGYDGKVVARDYVPYAVCSLWANALDLARATKNKALEDRLVQTFEPFYGEKAKKCSQPYHVDMTIFGSVPYAVYLSNKDPRALKLGNKYADIQWAKPRPDDVTKLPKWLQSPEHTPSYEKQMEYFKNGYTPQTRLWIDDMYMITLLQVQAYRATGNRRYLERAAKEMCLYLKELQLKEGESAGLFYHAPDVPFVWGRGDGWMAAGMALLLNELPAQSFDYHEILEGYQKMMAALHKFQREDGLWGQLVNEPTSWGETSGTAMFTYAFIKGVKNGWLCPKTYGPAARKAWIALCGKLDEFGNLPDICIGTGKKNDHQYYLDRKRMRGDAHGQAPMLWCANALLAPAKTEERKR